MDARVCRFLITEDEDPATVILFEIGDCIKNGTVIIENELGALKRILCRRNQVWKGRLQSVSHAAGHDFVEDRHDRNRAVSGQIVSIAFLLVDKGDHYSDHLGR